MGKLMDKTCVTKWLTFLNSLPGWCMENLRETIVFSPRVVTKGSSRSLGCCAAATFARLVGLCCDGVRDKPLIFWVDLGDYMGMDQYLLTPFLGGWTSIYQLFWCSPGVQGFDTLPYEFCNIARLTYLYNGIDNPHQYWQYYHQYRGSHVFISCLNHMQDVINTHVASCSNPQQEWERQDSYYVI